MATRPIKNIYLEPVNKVMEELDNTTKANVLLIGGEGTGKSVVLNEYISRNNNPTNLIINGTAEHDNLIPLADHQIFELCQICLVIQKMLAYVKVNHANNYLGKFADLEERINYILRIIDFMYFYGNYTLNRSEIGQEILENPGVLLEEFLGIATKTLEYETITIVLDNFDVVGGPNQHYQEYMYRMLSQYMRLVVTVSDSRIINSSEQMVELAKTNDIVSVNYTQDVEVIKEILNSVFIQSSILSGNTKYRVSIDLMLSDETISLMIAKTNGNLFDIIKAVRVLYSKMDELLPSEYDTFVLDYIDRQINQNPIFTGHTKKVRRLFIK